MASVADMERIVGVLRVEVTTQGERVRILKTDESIGKELLKQEIDRLKSMKITLSDATKKLDEVTYESKPLYVRCRSRLDNLLKRRFFVGPSFEIYGGVGGLIDFGPPGCALKTELEAFWRRHFVLGEDMQEISSTCLSPQIVLKTSGHVERFTDLIVKDTVTQECFRADKYLEDFLQTKMANSKDTGSDEYRLLQQTYLLVAGYGASEIKAAFDEYSVKSPEGNPLSDPYPFNLMFRTTIGPKQETTSGGMGSACYLRPETAQGIFVNFRRLLEQNQGRLPMNVAQLGLGFRNEIAPRNGLLRTREFQMAEIEHFVDPQDKNHPRFEEIKRIKLPLFSRTRQLSDGRVEYNLTVDEAVQQKIIGSETLAYFTARTYQFLIACGIHEKGVRFRQHLSSEMAHYASDCWDADVENSFGWVECAGHADRSAFDLTKHSQESKVDLVASRKLLNPETRKVLRILPNKALIGKAFKQDQNIVIAALNTMKEEAKLAMQKELESDGVHKLLCGNNHQFIIEKSMLGFEWTTVRVTEEPFTPSVIEPSFGIGRILYCILEHCFRSREIEGQEERCYLALPARLAPIKCSILAISAQEEFKPFLNDLRTSLTNLGISCRLDNSSATIGKRYARTDEIGVPFGLTVDFQTISDQTVTLRERDSMKQVRLKKSDAPGVVADLIHDRITWQGVQASYPVFVQQEI